MASKEPTPGPFTVEFDGPSRPIICGPNFVMLSISKKEYEWWGSYENEEADCRLFAAASELLAAAIEVTSGSHYDDCLCSLCRAIAKVVPRG